MAARKTEPDYVEREQNHYLGHGPRRACARCSLYELENAIGDLREAARRLRPLARREARGEAPGASRV